MNDSRYGKTGRAPVLRQIDAEAHAILRAENQIHDAEKRIAALEALLKYCECPRCGAELEGGIQAAQELADAAKLIDRTEVPCAFCDTEDQTKAMEQALERVGG